LGASLLLWLSLALVSHHCHGGGVSLTLIRNNDATVNGPRKK
jgi:hypothetical protein